MTKVTKWLAVGVFGVGLFLGASGQASADTVCSTYNTANGATTFPGTYVGTVGASGCQIGDLTTQSLDKALVNTSNNPSIYEFYYAGGALTIQEQIGNNGIGDAVDVELDSLASSTSTSGSKLASIQIPYTSGPSSAYALISDQTLAAGYYAIDTYLAINNATDPDYQINITDPPTATPEPSSLLLLSSGLAGLGYMKRKVFKS